MAGISSSTPRRTWVRAVAVTVGLTIAGMLVGPAVSAQVPPVPAPPGVPGAPGVPPLPVGPPEGVPDLPAPVAGVIDQAEDTLIPVMIDGAAAAEPAVNAGGFALRGPCGATGTAIVLMSIGAGAAPLPISVGVPLTPVFLICGAAYEKGPADPVFNDADAAVGPQFEDATDPVLKQVGDAIAPVRTNLAQACTVIALSGGTIRSVPKPLSRLDIVNAVC